MKLTYLTSKVAKIGRFLAIAMFCLFATFGFTNNIAMAANNPTFAAFGMGGEAKEKASEDAQNTKGFVDDVKGLITPSIIFRTTTNDLKCT